MTRRITKVLSNNVLVLMDELGKPHIEVRPYYRPDVGPAIQFYRSGISDEHESAYMFTLRLRTVQALVRKLPIVTAAALRLQNGDRVPGR